MFKAFSSSRRLALAALAALALTGPAALAQSATDSLPDDMVLGQDKAPVTLVEYASVGCPHCATFHNEVWPTIKEKYVATGKVRFVFREMITGNPQVAMGGFITARCADKKRYFDVVDQVFRDQNQLVLSLDLKTELKAIAKKAGVTDKKFETCIASKDAVATIAARSDSNAQFGGVRSTPSFFVNGAKLDGPYTLATFEAAFQAAETAAKT